MHSERKKKPRRKISITWILLGTLGIFTVLMLGSLWLLQTVYLDSFYQRIKQNEIETAMENVSDAISDSDLDAVLEQLAEDYGICSLIADETGTEIMGAEASFSCVIHRWDPRLLYTYMEQADSGETVSEILDHDWNQRWLKEKTLTDGNKDNTGGIEPMRPDKPNRLDGMPNVEDTRKILMVRKVTTQAGESRYIFLNSMISPVDATVHTLKIQLIYVSVIMLVVAFLLAVLISSLVAKPIIRLNRAAKQLGGRDFDVQFDSHEYREVSELSETLNHAAVELGKAERLQRELLANVSHDLRTPLTMIMGYAEVMRDLPGENSPENIQVIIDESNRLTRLVNDMLDISKIQSGVANIEKKIYNLTGSIGIVIDRYAKMMENEGYTIRFEYDCPAYVEADEFKIYQVIYNLVSNAVNYTGADRTVLVKQRVQDGIVHVSVIDSGAGIPEEELENVWERYYKIDKTHKRAIMGTGLGLSIVQGVLKLHGAAYGVESEIGKGSCFWFELPTVARPDEGAEGGIEDGD